MTTPPNTQPDAAQIAREIRAGLEGVTPGPWGWFEAALFPHNVIVAKEMSRETETYEDELIWQSPIIETDSGAYGPNVADAAHIANCSPDRIAILLDAFDDQTREIAELREALEPFARVANINDALPPHLITSDDVGARDYMSGVWPTVGDLRRAHSALRAKENPNG